MGLLYRDKINYVEIIGVAYCIVELDLLKNGFLTCTGSKFWHHHLYYSELPILWNSKGDKIG